MTAIIPSREATELELGMAEILRTSPQMIRFHGIRMGVELALERNLSKEEYAKLYSRVFDSFPSLRQLRNHRRATRKRADKLTATHTHPHTWRTKQPEELGI